MIYKIAVPVVVVLQESGLAMIFVRAVTRKDYFATKITNRGTLKV